MAVYRDDFDQIDGAAVVAAWDEVAHGVDIQTAIHPSGIDGEQAYSASGLAAAERVSKAVYRHLAIDREPASIIDYGCGDGRVTEHLARYFNTVVGVDSSATMIERAKARCHETALEARLAFIQTGDITAQVDALCALAVLIHQSHDDAREIVRQCAEWVRPGGVLVLDVPCYEISRERSTWCDVSTWTRGEIEQLAVVADALVVECHTSPGAFSYENIGTHHGDWTVLQRNGGSDANP